MSWSARASWNVESHTASDTCALRTVPLPVHSVRRRSPASPLPSCAWRPQSHPHAVDNEWVRWPTERDHSPWRAATLAPSARPFARAVRWLSLPFTLRANDAACRGSSRPVSLLHRTALPGRSFPGRLVPRPGLAAASLALLDGVTRPAAPGGRGEAHLSAQQPAAGQAPRLPASDVHPRGSRHPEVTPGQGPAPAVGLIWWIRDRAVFDRFRTEGRRAPAWRGVVYVDR